MGLHLKVQAVFDEKGMIDKYATPNNLNIKDIRKINKNLQHILFKMK